MNPRRPYAVRGRGSRRNRCWCRGTGDGVKTAGGRWDEPTQANTRGDRLDYGETAGLDEVRSGSVVMFCRVHVGIFMRGVEGAPRRSVDPESGIVWCPLATKISVSDEPPSRGGMSARQWPVRAEPPEGRTKLTGIRNGVDESGIACTPAYSRWKVSVVGRLSLVKVGGPSVRGTERESLPKIGWEG